MRKVCQYTYEKCVKKKKRKNNREREEKSKEKKVKQINLTLFPTPPKKLYILVVTNFYCFNVVSVLEFFFLFFS